MPKEPFPISLTRGFSLIEVLISSGLILMLAMLFTAAVLNAQEDAVVGGMRARASLMAEGALEVARNIRDRDFDALVVGTHGIDLNNDAWSLEYSSVTLGIFTISLTIQAVDAVTKQVTSTVTWPQTGNRTGTLSMVSYLTNLQQLGSQVEALEVDISGGHLSTNSRLSGIKLKNVGSAPITLSKIKVAWSAAPSSRLTEIVLEGDKVWSTTGPGSPSGQQASGSTVTIVSESMPPGTNTIFNRFQFTRDMRGNSFTLTFIMADNSSTTITTPVLQ